MECARKRAQTAIVVMERLSKTALTEKKPSSGANKRDLGLVSG
jgi:hypothetical protein